jgi:hypothetical protein
MNLRLAMNLPTTYPPRARRRALSGALVTRVVDKSGNRFTHKIMDTPFITATRNQQNQQKPFPQAKNIYRSPTYRPNKTNKSPFRKLKIFTEVPPTDPTKPTKALPAS